jgi:hypothetical protein
MRGQATAGQGTVAGISHVGWAAESASGTVSAYDDVVTVVEQGHEAHGSVACPRPGERDACLTRGCRRTGGIAGGSQVVGTAQVGGGAAPAAEPWALDGIRLPIGEEKGWP